MRYPSDLPSDSEKWTPGGLYFDEPLLVLPRWHFWRDGFWAVTEKPEASDECKAVAIKAADMMDSVEKNMTF
jgi:hypothetical protein